MIMYKYVNECIWMLIAVLKIIPTFWFYCYQKFSDLLWEKLFQWLRITFEIQSWEFAKNLRPVEQFIQAVEGQNNLL